MGPSIRNVWKWHLETVLVLALVLASFLTILVLLNLFFPYGQGFFGMIRGIGEESLSASGAAHQDRRMKVEARNREQDLLGSASRTATLSRMANHVKSRRSTQIAWADATPGMILHDRDAVQTGKRSSARLTFGNRNYLDMEQNSLVVIRSLERDVFLNEDRTVAVLIDGRFSGEFRKSEGGSYSIELVTPGAVASFPSPSRQEEPTSFKMTVNRDESSILTVFQGTADLQVQDQILEIGANQIVKVLPGEQPIFLLPPPQPPEPLEPDDGQTFFFRNLSPKVPFSWSTSKDGLRYRFSLAGDPEFEEIIYEEIISRPRFAHGNLKPGEYFWRVNAIETSEEGGVSPTRRFELIQDLEPPSLEVQYSEEAISGQELFLTGSTDPDAELFVSGIPVPVDDQGRFEYNLRLKQGWNVLVIEAVDHVGNVAYFSRTLNVEF